MYSHRNGRKKEVTKKTILLSQKYHVSYLRLTLLRCVGYFSIVAWRAEIQLDLDELWLPVLSFLDTALACEVHSSLHQRALV